MSDKSDYIRRKVAEFFADPNSKTKRWVFTYNNPVKDELFTESTLPKVLRYIVWQKEKADTTGTLHLQGYLELMYVKTFKEIKSFFAKNFPKDANPHIEPAITPRKFAAGYCTKDHTKVDGPWEIGTPAAPGSRTDLLPIIESLREDNDLNVVADKYPETFIQFHKGIQAYSNILPTKFYRRDHVNVLVILGSTNIGKTYNFANRFTPETLYRPLIAPDRVWFDKYKSQKTILLDEFLGHEIKSSELIHIVDPHPYTVQERSKPGGYEACWNSVIITSNIHPDDWYTGLKSNPKTKSHWDAVRRRFNNILDFRRPPGEDIEVGRKMLITALDRLGKIFTEKGDPDYMPALTPPPELTKCKLSTIDFSTLLSTEDEEPINPPPTKVVKTVSI